MWQVSAATKFFFAGRRLAATTTVAWRKGPPVWGSVPNGTHQGSTPMAGRQQQQRAATTLVLAEPGGPATAATCQAVSAAMQLGNDKITLVSVSNQTTAQQHVPQGVTKFLSVVTTDTAAAVVLPETVALAVSAAVAADSDITHIVAASSKAGATVVPRIAALLDCSPVTDVVEIVSNDTVIRPMYAGNVLAKVQMTDAPRKVVSIRPTAFEKAPLVDISSVASESMTVEAFAGSAFVSESVSKSDARPDLGSANAVVSGGRGMGSADQFGLLEALADVIGAGTTAIGASRAAVDAGMAPNDWQVGQTGKVVAPDLYVAVGISGAIQHLSGMKDSKTIVAINKDPEAPIFQVADYGLVADLFEAVPEMTRKLKESTP